MMKSGLLLAVFLIGGGDVERFLTRVCQSICQMSLQGIMNQYAANNVLYSRLQTTDFTTLV